MSKNSASEVPASVAKLSDLETKIAVSHEKIRDLEAKNESIQSQITRYKLLSAAGSIALAAGGIALFFVFNLVDDEVQRLVRATEPIEERQEQITVGLNDMKLKVTSLDTKVVETRSSIEEMAANALDRLAAEIDETLTKSTGSLEQKRDEILANVEFDKLTTKALSVVDDNGHESVRIRTGRFGGEIKVLDPENDVDLLVIGSGENRTGGYVKTLNGSNGKRIAQFGASEQGDGGVWFYDKTGEEGLRLLGGTDSRLVAFDRVGKKAANLIVNDSGAYLNTFVTANGNLAATIGTDSATGHGGVWVNDKTGTRRGGIFANAIRPVVFLNGVDGRLAVELEAPNKGDGALFLYNSDGKIVAEIVAARTGGYFRVRSPETGQMVARFGGSSINDTGFLQLFDNRHREYFGIQHRNGTAEIRSYILDSKEVFFKLATDRAGQQFLEVAGETVYLDEQ